MSEICKGCVFFNEDKKSDEKHGHYCSKHDDYVLANEYTCDDYKPNRCDLFFSVKEAENAIYAVFEKKTGGADNGGFD